MEKLDKVQFLTPALIGNVKIISDINHPKTLEFPNGWKKSGQNFQLYLLEKWYHFKPLSFSECP
jgi:hypothetical protein